MRRKGRALAKRFFRIRRKVINSDAGSAFPAGDSTEFEKEATMSYGGPQSTSGRFSWLKHTTSWLVALALGMLVGGTVWIFIYAFSTPGSHWSYVAVGMLTALTAVLVGFFTGFLIGVPRSVSSGQARLSNNNRKFSPSTNLAEISDWLTKLLLGAGLVSLSRLGGPIGRLIDNVAGGLHGVTINPAIIQAAKVTAGAIMIAFAVLGLLAGYIVTSTWYERRLEKTFSPEGTGEVSQQNPSGTAKVTGTTGTPPPS
jgi:hypothetical protein